jgi:class I fructose-bisphosphate aldolase
VADELANDPSMGLFIHLFGSTSVSPDPNDKHVVCSVQHAMSVGADAVSVHVNIGAVTEARMLRDFAQIAEECDGHGIPLLAMMYARGPRMMDAFSEDFNAHCARIAYEIGADIVKICYTGSVESFRRICESVDIPVVIAGGEKMDSSRDVLQMVSDSLQAGGAGVAFGRNIFGTEDPKAICRAMNAVIHENASVDDAMKILN